MSSLSIATHGMMPLCPLGLNTLGQIACESSTNQSGGGAGRRRRKVISLDKDIVIKGQTETILIGEGDAETEVEYQRADTVRFAPPVTSRAREVGEDPETEELSRLLQRQAIIDHQRRVLAQIEEENRQAEELAVFLMLLEDD